MKSLNKKTKIELEISYSKLLYERDAILDDMYVAELKSDYKEWDILYDKLTEVEKKIELHEIALNF